MIVIDNYDSFTYNIVEYFRILGEDVKVFKNDEIKIPDLEKMDFKSIVLSPGPSNPDNSGLTMAVIRRFYKEKSILGVCLGAQAIAQVFGAKIVKSDNPMHGKCSKIYFDEGKNLFKDVPQGFLATRYHSLVIDKSTIKSPVVEIARTGDAVPMAIKVEGFNVYGVQFHPEAILTEHGLDIFRNFLAISKG